MLLAACNLALFPLFDKTNMQYVSCRPLSRRLMRLNEISSSSTLTSWNCLRGKGALHFNMRVPVSPNLYKRSVCQWTVFVLFFSLLTLLESFCNRWNFKVGKLNGKCVNKWILTFSGFFYFSLCVFNIHFNIIFPSGLRSPEHPISFIFSDKNYVNTVCLTYLSAVTNPV